MIILSDSELLVSDTVVSQPSRPHHRPVQVCHLGVMGLILRRLDEIDSLLIHLIFQPNLRLPHVVEDWTNHGKEEPPVHGFI